MQYPSETDERLQRRVDKFIAGIVELVESGDENKIHEAIKRIASFQDDLSKEEFSSGQAVAISEIRLRVQSLNALIHLHKIVRDWADAFANLVNKAQEMGDEYKKRLQDLGLPVAHLAEYFYRLGDMCMLLADIDQNDRYEHLLNAQCYYKSASDLIDLGPDGIHTLRNYCEFNAKNLGMLVVAKAMHLQNPHKKQGDEEALKALKSFCSDRLFDLEQLVKSSKRIVEHPGDHAVLQVTLNKAGYTIALLGGFRFAVSKYAAKSFVNIILAAIHGRPIFLKRILRLK